MSRGRYLRVLRAPGVAFILPTSLVARLPVAMLNLAIILRIATATGSYARAGSVTGVYVVSTGVMSPILGRLADRIGLRRVLTATAVVNASGLVALAFVPVHATAALLVVAAVAGGSLPPVAAAVRSLWTRIVSGAELRSSLYAFDATMQEVTFMVGPTLVALISSISGPSAAVLACAAIGLAGTVALTVHPAISARRPSEPAAGDLVEIEATSVSEQARTEAGAGTPPTGLPPAEPPLGGNRPPAQAPPGEGAGTERRRRFQLAGMPGLATLVLIMLLFLVAIAIVEVTVVAFATRHHESAQAGLLLATWSSGSMVGGLTIGARIAHAGARALALLLLTAALGFGCLAVATGVDFLYPLMFIAGVSIAPGFSCIYGLVGASAPPSGVIEAFSWVSSGIQMGAAGGAALGGILVDSIGTRWTFLFSAGLGLATAVIAWWRTHHLRPAAA